MSIFKQKVEFDQGVPYLDNTLNLKPVLCPRCHEQELTFLNEKAYCDHCQKRITFKKEAQSQRDLGFLWLKEAISTKGLPMFVISVYKKAISAFQKSLKEEENEEAYEGLIFSLCQIGQIYLDSKELSKALSQYKKAAKWQEELLRFKRDAMAMYDFGELNYILYKIANAFWQPGVRKYLAAAIEWVDKACSVEKNREIEWAMRNRLEFYAYVQASHYQRLHLRKEISSSTVYLAKIIEQKNLTKTKRFPVDPDLLPHLPEVIGRFYFERYPEKGRRLIILLAQQAFDYFIAQKDHHSLDILVSTITAIIDICKEKHQYPLAQDFLRGLARLPENEQVLEIKKEHPLYLLELERLANWNLGLFYSSPYSLQEAKDYLDKAISLQKQILKEEPDIENYEILIRMHYHLILAYQKAKKEAEMMDQLYFTLNLIKEMPEPKEVSESLKDIRAIFSRMNEIVFDTFKRRMSTNAGIAYLDQVLLDFQTQSGQERSVLTKVEEQDIYRYLARFYRQKKEEKKEREYLDKVKEIDDQLYPYHYEDGSASNLDYHYG